MSGFKSTLHDCILAMAREGFSEEQMIRALGPMMRAGARCIAKLDSDLEPLVSRDRRLYELALMRQIIDRDLAASFTELAEGSHA